MDADVDSAWICTQAIGSIDSQSDDEQEKINNVSTSYYMSHIYFNSI